MLNSVSKCSNSYHRGIWRVAPASAEHTDFLDYWRDTNIGAHPGRILITDLEPRGGPGAPAWSRAARLLCCWPDAVVVRSRPAPVTGEIEAWAAARQGRLLTIEASPDNASQWRRFFELIDSRHRPLIVGEQAIDTQAPPHEQFCLARQLMLKALTAWVQTNPYAADLREETDGTTTAITSIVEFYMQDER
jgi:hypothetical protein